MKRLASTVGKLPDGFGSYCLCEILIRIHKEDCEFITHYLSEILQDYPLFDFFGIGERDHLFEGIGKIENDHGFRRFDDYLEVAPSRLLVDVSDIFRALFKDDTIGLVERLKAWNEPDTLRFDIRMDILKDTISDLLESDDGDDRIVIDSCVGSVREISEAMGLDVKSVAKGENNQVFQALMLIDEIQHPPRSVDCDQLIQNLTRIPNICRFVSKEWFTSMCVESAPRHLLLYMFDHKMATDSELSAAIVELQNATDINTAITEASKIDRMYYSRNIIAYWDDIFSRLGQDLPGLGQCRKDLQRNDRAEDTLCELEVISLLRRRHRVDVRRTVNGLRGPYDSRPHLTIQSPILEVYNLQPERVVRHASGVHGLDTSRLKSKILQKFNAKYDKNVPSLGEPYVFVVNISSSLVHADEIHIHELYNGKTSLSEKNPDTTRISGILVYRRILTGTDHPRVIAQYYGNPRAEVPLEELSVTELTESLSLPERPSVAGSRNSFAGTTV
ncbi:MAG: hypothetical protein KKE24_09380 [Candidatus Thermoplasmatota archaeon]|nr:hypothetical protein [Candidatus Thermoplasmatota archaeon]